MRRVVDLSDRQLFAAGMSALWDNDTVAPLAVLQCAAGGDANYGGRDEDAGFRDLAAAALDLGRTGKLTPPHRAKVLEAFATHGVNEDAIVAEAEELA
jgi:hypothetical protein